MADTFLQRRLIPAGVSLLPLACWPSLAQPFSTPKLWLIAGLDVLLVVQYAARAREAAIRMPPWPWLAWIAAVALSGLTAPLLSADAFLLLLLPLPLAAANVDPRALCLGSFAESAIVLLQYFHRDPFRWLGWQPEAFASPRMRVYGTLGNPDFVAAWLAATLPLCLVVRRRGVRAAFIVVIVVALFCTGSRVALLAVPAALFALAAAGWRPGKWWLAAAALLVAVLWFSPARPLGATVQGRLHFARVTATHLHDVPATGFGSGAFEPMFAGWQAAWLRQHAEDRRFEGPVDHAHNDYLEFWVEYGPVGVVAFGALCGWLLWRRFRSGSAPLFAALAALLAIACVDFPFHRPAGWALFAVLAGAAKEE